MNGFVNAGGEFQNWRCCCPVIAVMSPCNKIAGRHDVKDLTLRVQTTGYYFRVLEEGTVSPDSSIERLSIHPAKMTFADANEIVYEDKNNSDPIQKLLAIEEL